MRRVRLCSAVVLARTAFVALLLAVPLPSLAQSAPPAPSPATSPLTGPASAGSAARKQATAVRVPKGTITVDGRLDEAAWTSAPPADGFVQQQPREGAPVTDGHRSAIRFVYDDEYLYIGATFHEDEMDKLVVNELRRDFNARAGDLFVVILDTFHDRLNAYNFQTNPRCALRDSQSYDDGRTINANWDAVWTCRSSVADGAWYVEEAVPFKQLRFPRSEVQQWGLQVFRLVRHSNEQTIWSPTPRQFNQFKTSFAGVLEGIEGVRPGRNIRVKPFGIARGADTGGRRSGDGDGGLDVKVGLGTNLVLDGTWRTDFSQVEADAQQINLTRFSLFFPEKREFFLENQGAFQIGPPAGNSSNLVPFFSRTIGLSDTGTPIPIVGGARLTGKVGRTSVAMLTMRTEPEVRTTTSTLPAATYSVMRVGREFFANSMAGVFVLDKQRGEAGNRLVGADFRVYPTRQWSLDGMVMHSEKTGVGGGDAWRAGTQYDAGRTQASVSFTSLGPTFRNELGFVPRQDVDILTASLLRRVRPRALARHVREIRPQVSGSRYRSGSPHPVTGRPRGVDTAVVGPQVTVELSDASLADYGVTWNEELLVAPFRPQGIPSGRFIAPGRYEFVRHTASFEINNARRFAPGIAVRTGGYYDGSGTGGTIGARYRLNEYFATTAALSRDVIHLRDGTRFATDLATLRLDASMSTRMFLNAFVQYNSVTRQLASNIRYQFIHHPLSDVFLVYNDARFIDVARPTALQVPGRSLTLKVTHLFSF